MSAKDTRSSKRTKATKGIKNANAELAKSAPCTSTLRRMMRTLEEIRTELKNLDAQVATEILGLSTAPTQKEAEKEDEDCERYEDSLMDIIIKIEDALKPGATPSSSTSSAGSTITITQPQKSYKLPQMELKKFSGELSEWLGFWASYQRVHNDKEMDGGEKFIFLSQCMVPGSSAQKLVEAYPMSKDNYPKAVTALEERFGKKTLLRQYYVRQLLSMVGSREKEQLSTLYDKLKSRYEALQSLGVTGEQTSEFLYPIVESCLPEEVMIAWQRSSNYGLDGSTAVPPVTKLDYLMNFLQKEVDNETQRTIARAEFSGSKPSQGGGSKRERWQSPQQKGKSEMSTTANLFGGVVNKKNKDKPNCLFCERVHLSQGLLQGPSHVTVRKRRFNQKEKSLFYLFQNRSSS